MERRYKDKDYVVLSLANSILDLGLPLAYSAILYFLFSNMKFRFLGKYLRECVLGKKAYELGTQNRITNSNYLSLKKRKLFGQFKEIENGYIWFLRKRGKWWKYFLIPWIPRHCFETVHLNNMISLILISTGQLLNLYLFKARMRLDWWPSGSASCLLAPTARVSQEFQVKIPLTPNLTEQPWKM